MKKIYTVTVLTALLALASSASATLGNLSNDLVFTPIQPCRIIDTRSTGAGAIAANTTRSFVAINSSNFAGQGGSATNCGTLGLSATAVAVNVTAVTPSAAGFATIYPFGTAQPLASSINYGAGAVVNNALTVQIPNPLSSSDFTIYTAAASHYVADIVGYYAPPVATALQCEDTTPVSTLISTAFGGSFTAALTPTACNPGYTQVALRCYTSSYISNANEMNGGTCGGNSILNTTFLYATRTCCRIPGR